MSTTTTTPYALSDRAGIADVWWPYGPRTGLYSFKATGDQTGGRLCQVHIRDSRGAATPLHIHRDADETFYVLAGEIEVVVGAERFGAGAGDFVYGPQGVPHGFVVTSDEAEILVTFGSAGTAGPDGFGMEGFFREVAVPVVDGEPAPAPRTPDPALFAERMAAYGIDLVGPPVEAA